ncbi:dimethylallyl tryptophan synthase FgaPT2 [Penicillium longicatenatum]|nr:dimethylallyl tryptophan synthase FgaPT2 [Penicillium longicatenatum]
MKPFLETQTPTVSNASDAEVYRILSAIFDFPNEDQKLWWHSTAPMFAQMLKLSGLYDLHTQYKFLGLYKKSIVPFLGVYPLDNDRDRWMSILTRYGTPFELSLNCSDSIVRFTYEPINNLTGTSQDPFNTHAIWDALSQLLRLQNIDLQWLKHLKERLTVNDEESQMLKERLAGDPIRTQNKLALDLKPDGTFVPKTYIYPSLKSLATGKSIHDLIFDSVRELAASYPSIGRPLSVLEEYIQSRGLESTASPRLISCDLAKPTKSRIKIYLLEQVVSFDAVLDLWTLGGRRQDSSSLAGLELLRELWDLIQLPTGHIPYPAGFLPLGAEVNEQLPLMVNYTLHHNDPIPEPQVYLTTFGMNDMAVMNALCTFFANKGWNQMAQSYREEVCSYYPHADHNSMNYIHAYISFSYRKEKPYLSVYLQSLETGNWSISSFTDQGKAQSDDIPEQILPSLSAHSKGAMGYSEFVAPGVYC